MKPTEKGVPVKPERFIDQFAAKASFAVHRARCRRPACTRPLHSVGARGNCPSAFQTAARQRPASSPRSGDRTGRRAPQGWPWRQVTCRLSSPIAQQRALRTGAPQKRNKTLKKETCVHVQSSLICIARSCWSRHSEPASIKRLRLRAHSRIAADIFADRRPCRGLSSWPSPGNSFVNRGVCVGAPSRVSP